MKNKVTKSLPILTKREKETISRFKTYNNYSSILIEFFDMGFKSFNAFKAIMQHNYPEIDEVKLKRFWSCALMESEIVEKVKIVFEKLKSE